jgi:signal recognition particle receptor subunit beta
MALLFHQTREITFKVVYCGCPWSGKTTNLAWIHGRMDRRSRGELISLATSQDRTLFFDYLAVDTPAVAGFRTRFQLYTVPGQVQYDATRQIVMRGADGLVFVADSGAQRQAANAEAWRALLAMRSAGEVSVRQLPMVLQYNKRDAADAVPAGQLNHLLGNPEGGRPVIEACAVQGTGVFQTLNAIARLVLRNFQSQASGLAVS